MNVLEEGMILVPGMMEQNKGIPLCYSEQHSLNLQTISGIFHMLLLDFGYLWVTDTTENKTTDNTGLL
jgi:hypothetical protein